MDHLPADPIFLPLKSADAFGTAKRSAKVAPIAAPERIVDDDDARGAGEALWQDLRIVAVHNPLWFPDGAVMEFMEFDGWALLPVAGRQMSELVYMMGGDG